MPTQAGFEQGLAGARRNVVPPNRSKVPARLGGRAPKIRADFIGRRTYRVCVCLVVMSRVLKNGGECLPSKIGLHRWKDRESVCQECLVLMSRLLTKECYPRLKRSDWWSCPQSDSILTSDFLPWDPPYQAMRARCAQTSSAS